MKKIFILLFVFSMTFSNYLLAASDFSTNAAVSVMSNYMWRGEKLSSRGVMQPEITLTNGGFSFGTWWNYDFDKSTDNETDYLLYYDWTIKHFSLEAGYCRYSFKSANDTREYYATITHNSAWSPSLSFYRDDDEGSGNYLSLGISHSWKYGKKDTLNAGATIGYDVNHKALGVKKNGNTLMGLYNAQIDLSLDMPVNKTLTITPKIGYSFPLSSDADDAISSMSYGGDSSTFYGGITITANF